MGQIETVSELRELWGHLCPRTMLANVPRNQPGWFVIVPAGGGATYKHFDTHEEAVAHVAECRQKLAEHFPGIPFQIHLERSLGYSPPPPVRLPIYGERPIDAAIRALNADATFGEFLFEGNNLKKYAELLQLIDENFDPTYASINDIRELFRRTLGDNDEHNDDLDDEYDDQLADEIEACADLLEESSRRWLLRMLPKNLIPRDRVLKHVCHVVLPPISPWPEGPGVYFARAGNHVKIGKANSIRKRLGEIHTYTPSGLELLATAPGGLREEGNFHRQWSKLREHGEWFRLDPELMAFIVSLREKP